MAAAIAEALPGLVSEFVSDDPRVLAALAVPLGYGYKRLYDWYTTPSDSVLQEPVSVFGEKMTLIRRRKMLKGARAKGSRMHSRRVRKPTKRRRAPLGRRLNRRAVNKRPRLRTPRLDPSVNAARTTRVMKSAPVHAEFAESLTQSIDATTNSGVKHSLAVNDYNQPWTMDGDSISTGAQVFGHDQIMTRYNEVTVKAVMIRLHFTYRKLGGVGGIFWAKLSDDANVPALNSHGAAWTPPGVNTTLGAGFIQLVKASPRYSYYEIRPSSGSEGQYQTRTMNILFTPRKVFLDYDRSDFTTTLKHIGSSTAPAKMAHLHFGFISYDNSADSVMWKMTKTYFNTYGNPVQVANS